MSEPSDLPRSCGAEAESDECEHEQSGAGAARLADSCEDAAGAAEEDASVELGEREQSDAGCEREHRGAEGHEQFCDGRVEPEPLQ